MRAVDDWRPPKATTNFGIFIFLPEIRWLERLDGVLSYCRRPARRLSQEYTNDMADFRLVVVSSHPEGAIELQGPIALSIFIFLPLYLRPKTMGTHPPPRVPPVRIASPTPPPPSAPSFGWLLHISIENQPPKTSAPPVSQFFHGCHFGAHNKGTKRSARKPGRRAPLSFGRGPSKKRVKIAHF